ncbi:DUF1684 domain-containing protein [Flavobacterium sedimenticola]|uniref:DUF1684 domain-containing protein n=1 Tax=Flavobacterium sedimenticola TaxID=3043286 RepID=A0ABT6XTT6_9FLAO|nr:DUF1684 domain-containing protein [Flavobacterium sedimenticola]MDI9258390.1 DUF1684 domain-containing protein [Flavobacterium sedimenticola]
MKKLCFLILLFQASLLLSQEKAQEFQNNLNKEFATREDSPLTEEDFKVFKGLSFYPITEKFIVQAQFVRTPNEKVFKMKTTSSRLPEYVKYGELHFAIDGQAFQLNVYQNIDLIQKEGYEDYLFLPFSDLTCGKESYIGGRYLDMRIPKSETVVIDFNKAYNPYCAYNHKYSCPIVPLENDLPIEILAGVKKFHD